MKLVFETHSHSYVSDGVGSPELLVRVASSKGINVLSVTDHDTFRGSALAWRASRYLNVDVTIIHGAEVLTNWGEVLVHCPEPLKEPLPDDIIELREASQEANCVTVAPHPFQVFLRSVGRKLLDKHNIFDGIEVWNGKSLPFFNIPALIYARRLGKPALSGSDAHVPSAIGTAPSIVYADGLKPDDILEAIRKGYVRPTIGLPSLRVLIEDISWSIYRVL